MSHSPLLLQLVIILGTARALGFILRRLGQPPVIGEMAAGVVLGPVAFGAAFPDVHAEIFDPLSLAPLDGLSQLGLVLFMFIVGAELRLPKGTGRQAVAAGWISVLSVLVPMVLGLGVAALLYTGLAPPGVRFWPFALFIASALSITAFPVLARILKDRAMTQTTVGRLSLTSAALADVFAWVLLGLVAAIAESGRAWTHLAALGGGSCALALALLVLVRPLIRRMLSRSADGRPESALLAALLIGALACAYITHRLGLHAVFGAFLFGLCLPRDDGLLATLVERIQHVAILLLLPIFFALAGLNMTPDAFRSAGIGALLMIMGVAICGKLAGAAAGARIAGQPWRSSLAIGALMNARGLAELIVLQVGLDIGVIGRELFTMLMVMAVVTTVMTGPMLSAFTYRTRTAPQGETVR